MLFNVYIWAHSTVYEWSDDDDDDDYNDDDDENIQLKELKGKCFLIDLFKFFFSLWSQE